MLKIIDKEQKILYNAKQGAIIALNSLKHWSLNMEILICALIGFFAGVFIALLMLIKKTLGDIFYVVSTLLHDILFVIKKEKNDKD